MAVPEQHDEPPRLQARSLLALVLASSDMSRANSAVHNSVNSEVTMSGIFVLMSHQRGDQIR
jgi:hypothetical protein